jgi:sugar phosphate isomerase/epimerase
MSDWPVGISTGCFYNVPIFDCLEFIRANGFSMVEICSSPAHLDYHDKAAIRRAAELIDELGMEAYSFHAPFGKNIDITSPDDEKRQRSRQEVLTAAEAAAELKVRYFVFHAGPEEALTCPPRERLQRMDHAARTVAEIAEYCRGLKIGFVLENMLEHLLLGRIEDMLWIFGAADTVNVAACLDTGHAFLAGSLHQVMHKLSGHLKVVHANDNLGQGDDHLPPGEGNIDWRQVLDQLETIGFNGAFILELSGQGGKPPSVILEQARVARCLLRRIGRDIALSAPPTSAPGHMEIKRT